MNFEQFDMAMNALKTQKEHDRKCSKAISTVFPEGDILSYNNEVLNDAIVALLEHDTDDNGGWIEHFIWELDYGAKWREGSVTVDGKSVKLQTNEDLWEFLIKNATD